MGLKAFEISKMNINKKIFLLSIISLFLIFSGFSASYAQDEDAAEIQEDDQQTDDYDTPAYRVLGRNLTETESKLYQDQSEEAIKNYVLYKEQRLVIVRALGAVGEINAIDKVLERVPNTGDKTFTELVEFFTSLKEKYGRVSTGVDKVYISNIKDDDVAFRAAAHEAYANVFCNDLSAESEAKILKYFKDENALTYSKMVVKLQSTMTDDIKKAILFRILKEIKRGDLKTNQNFVKKIVGQSFTCDNLRRLLKEVGK
jgi:hypothetical protein